MKSKIKVIGIGPNGECFYSNLIDEAEILVGGKRILEFFPDFKGEIIILDKELKEKLANLKNSRKKIAILATGDPLFYGIGSTLLKIFDKNQLEFYPYLNSVQLLCSKVGINYEDIVNLSVHGKKLDESILMIIKHNFKVSLLTDNKHNINKIGEFLIKNNLTNLKIFLGQKIGTELEKIYKNITPFELTKIQYSNLDTLLIINNDYNKNYFTEIADNEFLHSKSLITKKEIRAIVISKLGVLKDSIVWDIGSGSGSVAIEMSSLCYNGKIFAIEKNLDRFEQLKKNIEKFSAFNVIPFNKDILELKEDLPIPDKVFIGGGSKDTILKMLHFFYNKRFSPITIVINLVSIKKLGDILDFLEKINCSFDVVSVSVEALQSITEDYYFSSNNRISIVKVSW